MKFRFNTADLNSAIELVSLVPPRPLNQSGGTGYLFIVRGETCFVYSRDDTKVARASFPISDVEGEGPFVYPSAYVGAFKLVGESCEMTVTQDDTQQVVEYVASSKAKGKHTTFDPKLLASCDRDLEEAQRGSSFPSGLLREALKMARPFLDSSSTEESCNKSLLIYDKERPEWVKGDGNLFATNSKQAIHFWSEAFVGKSLSCHSQHLAALSGFLAKCQGNVEFRRGKNHTFAVDGSGRAFGWAHHAKEHGKYSYYGLKSDQFVLNIPKEMLVSALRLVRSELDKNQDKIGVTYDHTDSTIRFNVSEGSTKAESFRVPLRMVPPTDKERQDWAPDQDFQAYANIDHFLGLVDEFKGNEVELRAVVVKQEGRKDKILFRTIDEFRMSSEGKVVDLKEAEGYHCRVTRFVSDRD